MRRDELERERQKNADQWRALSDDERQTKVQQQRQEFFDKLSKECPRWKCECKQVYVFKSQQELVESPFQCPTCDRVYDGRDWFKTTQLYNAITDWENIQAEAMWLTGERKLNDADDTKLSFDEIQEWALELMDICDAVTHQDVTRIWKFAESLWNHDRPLDANEMTEIRNAEAACRPLIELLWFRAKSRPSDPNEWGSQDVQAHPATLRPPPKLRPQQQELLDVIREAGHRLTTEQVLDALNAKGKRRSEGTTKNILASLVQFGPLTNATDEFGKGYGLPEWSKDKS
jgi:hypothetical protein